METSQQTEQHLLHTKRLRLRPLEVTDVDRVHQLANDPEIAANLSDLPYPYPREAVLAQIAAMPDPAALGEAFAFAIVRQPDETLIGVIYLVVDQANQRGELIYWLGRAFRGQGYATEAVQAIIAYAFNIMPLHRVYANVFGHNTASVHVLQKSGMQYEGTLQQHFLKNGQFVDVLCFGLLREAFDSTGTG